MKYIGKTRERLSAFERNADVFSNGYNVRDVLTKTGEEKEKLLWADHFGRWDKGRLGKANDGGKERTQKKNSTGTRHGFVK